MSENRFKSDSEYQEDFNTISMTSIFNTKDIEDAQRESFRDEPVKFVNIKVGEPTDEKKETSFVDVSIGPIEQEQTTSSFSHQQQEISFVNIDLPKEEIPVNKELMESAQIMNDIVDNVKEEIPSIKVEDSVFLIDEDLEEVIQPEKIDVQSVETNLEKEETIVQSEDNFIQTENVVENYGDGTMVLETVDNNPTEETMDSDKTIIFEPIDETGVVEEVINQVEQMEKQEEVKMNKQEEVPSKEKKKKKKKETIKYNKKGKEKLGFNWFLLITSILVAIPVGFVIYILMSASEETHIPILGDRLKNSIYQEINETQLNKVESEIKGINGVSNVSVNLTVATVRITIDTKDDATEEELLQMAQTVYEKTTSVLNVDTYFTQTSGYKQYDLEVDIFNTLGQEDSKIVILTKNSYREECNIQVVTNPKNKDLVDSLKGK